MRGRGGGGEELEREGGRVQRGRMDGLILASPANRPAWRISAAAAAGNVTTQPAHFVYGIPGSGSTAQYSMGP